MISVFLKRMINTDCILKKHQLSWINNRLKRLHLKKNKLDEKILKYGMLIDYNEYKMKGFSQEEINTFYRQDIEIIKEASILSRKYQNERNTMFGYPANMIKNNYMEDYLKQLDLQLPLLNNCGEIYKTKKNNCNYLMDSKIVEYQIVNLFCNNLGLSHSKYEGYVTSGGTEGNYYGLRQGMEKYPDGIVYYSSDAHYSIVKYLNLSNGKMLFQSSVIPANNDGTINSEELLRKIENNWKSKKKPAILVLTWGTTVYGSVDDIEYIVKELKKKGINYYLHLDAAFYGGIPKNQTKAPLIKDLNQLDVDSISVSLHKYIGCSLVGGIVLRKKANNSENYIAYIGQEDSTFLGSRSILPFSTLYHVNRVLNRSNSEEYNENIDYFERQLRNNKIEYSKYKNGNTFILYNVSKKIAQKYQLAALNQKKSYHVIIMPFHQKSELDELINDLIKMYEYIKAK